jgi:hypothetical protein
MRSFAQVLQEGLPIFFEASTFLPSSLPSLVFRIYLTRYAQVVEDGVGKAIKHGPDGPSSQNPELWW